MSFNRERERETERERERDWLPASPMCRSPARPSTSPTGLSQPTALGRSSRVVPDEQLQALSPSRGENKQKRHYDYCETESSLVEIEKGTIVNGVARSVTRRSYVRRRSGGLRVMELVKVVCCFFYSTTSTATSTCLPLLVLRLTAAAATIAAHDTRIRGSASNRSRSGSSRDKKSQHGATAEIVKSLSYLSKNNSQNGPR